MSKAKATVSKLAPKATPEKPAQSEADRQVNLPGSIHSSGTYLQNLTNHISNLSDLLYDDQDYWGATGRGCQIEQGVSTLLDTLCGDLHEASEKLKHLAEIAEARGYK